MNGIEIKQLSFSYPNGYTALKNINLEIKKGENIAILGQNGAGKTTLVKMMNGLLRPSSGEVSVNGNDIFNMTTARVSKMVGYVFQNPGDQIFNNTVFEEIAFVLKYNKVPKEEIKKIVSDVAELCGLKKYLDKNPYDLPFSTRKFVTIASVIATGADYIILDEPTAGQDLMGLNILKNIIKRLKELKKTIITITHDMDFVVENFEKIIVMSKRGIIANGLKEDIFYDFNILNESSLKQPIIAEISTKVGMNKKVMTIENFIKNLK